MTNNSSIAPKSATPGETAAFLSTVLPALITEKTHPSLASTCPHVPVPGTDLLEVTVIDGNYVTREDMQYYRCTQGELFSAASINQHLDQIYFNTVYSALGFLPPEKDDTTLYVLTSAQQATGAALILNKNIMQKASKTIGGDLLIIPSSVHEVLLVSPNAVKPEELESIVRDVNQQALKPDDRLSDHVYRYDCQTMQLSIATEQRLCQDVTADRQVSRPERRIR